MNDSLQSWAAQRGYRVAWGAAGVIEEARREIAAREAASEIEHAFYQDQLNPIISPTAESAYRTVVIVAKPRPTHIITFELDGSSFQCVFPPTYFRYRATFEDVRQDLARNVLGGSHVEFLPAPLKAIASHLGLVKYGRNNIAYVDGLGSYMQLCGYVTDRVLPETDSAAGSRSLLSDCEGCGICASVCPTGAIAEDRILLKAERCLTFVNENPGEWPEWLSPKSHNALLGCLECQRACPLNPEMPVEDTGVSFSTAETRRLISEESGTGYGSNNGIRSKLAWLGQPGAERVLGRNLKALLLSNKHLL
jgi:epoxyqueuosine reductase